jgi:diphthamide synthase subunit DPH2
MVDRKCTVLFDETSGRSTGRILEGQEVVFELSFYIGKLHDKQPEFAEQMIQERYRAWARVYGVETIEIIYQK